MAEFPTEALAVVINELREERKDSGLDLNDPKKEICQTGRLFDAFKTPSISRANSQEQNITDILVNSESDCSSDDQSAEGSNSHEEEDDVFSENEGSTDLTRAFDAFTTPNVLSRMPSDLLEHDIEAKRECSSSDIQGRESQEEDEFESREEEKRESDEDEQTSPEEDSLEAVESETIEGLVSDSYESEKDEDEFESRMEEEPMYSKEDEQTFLNDDSSEAVKPETIGESVSDHSESEKEEDEFESRVEEEPMYSEEDEQTFPNDDFSEAVKPETIGESVSDRSDLVSEGEEEEPGFVITESSSIYDQRVNSEEVSDQQIVYKHSESIQQKVYKHSESIQHATNEYTIDIENMKSQIKTAKESCEAYAREIFSLNETVSDLKSSLQSLDEASGQDKLLLESEVELVQSKLNECESKLLDSETSLKISELAVAKLNNEINEAKESCNIARESLENQTKLCDSLKIENENAVLETTKVKQELENAEKENGLIKNESESFRVQLSSYQQDAKDLKEQNASLQSKITTDSTRLKPLKNSELELAGRDEDLKKAEERLLVQIAETERLTEALSSSQQEAENFKEQNASLQSKLFESQEAFKDINVKMQASLAEKCDQIKTLQANEKSIESLNIKVEHLENEARDDDAVFSTTIAMEKEANVSLQSRVDVLESEVRENKAGAEMDLAAERESSELLKIRVDAQENEARESDNLFTTKISKERAINDSLRNKIESMEKETNDLKVANQSYENIKKSDSELLDKAITDLEKAKLAESELIAAVEKMKFDDAKESFESEIKVLSLQASEFSSDNQALKTKLKTSVDQNSASIQKLEEIRFEYAELKNKADDVVISSEASEEQYDNEITLKISEIRGLEGQIKSLAEEKESIINDQQQSIDALNDSLVSKSTELYDLKAHHENLLAESSRDLVKERVRLEETSRDLVKLKNQLAISKESSKIEIEKLESENQDLHELMLNIEEDLTESTSQSAEFKQTITDRGTGFLEITLSRTEIYLNMNKIEEARRERDKYANEIDHFRNTSAGMELTKKAEAEVEAVQSNLKVSVESNKELRHRISELETQRKEEIFSKSDSTELIGLKSQLQLVESLVSKFTTDQGITEHDHVADSLASIFSMYKKKPALTITPVKQIADITAIRKRQSDCVNTVDEIKGVVERKESRVIGKNAAIQEQFARIQRQSSEESMHISSIIGEAQVILKQIKEEDVSDNVQLPIEAAQSTRNLPDVPAQTDMEVLTPRALKGIFSWRNKIHKRPSEKIQPMLVNLSRELDQVYEKDLKPLLKQVESLKRELSQRDEMLSVGVKKSEMLKKQVKGLTLGIEARDAYVNRLTKKASQAGTMHLLMSL